MASALIELACKADENRSKRLKSQYIAGGNDRSGPYLALETRGGRPNFSLIN